MTRNKHTMNTIRKNIISKMVLLATTILVIEPTGAASPFANVPLYLSKIESINTKSNLMLVIDDSGSMNWFAADYSTTTPSKPQAIIPGNRMDNAIKAALSIVNDTDNQKNFNFGVAHLRITPDISTDGIPTNTNEVMVPIGNTDNPAHLANLRTEIANLRPYNGTPIYERLSAIYPIVEDAIEYRCQKSFVILITDGAPSDTNTKSNKASDFAKSDRKTSGNDAEGKSWNEKPWEKQTVKTSVIAFLTDIPEMKTLAKDGDGTYMTVANLNGLQDAISNMVKNLTKSPNPVPATPAISQVAGTDLNALSVRIYTDVSNWSSQLRFLQFSSSNNSEESSSGKLKYKSPLYGVEAKDRSTVINTKDHGIQSLDKDRLGAELSNASFDIDSSDANYWSEKFVPWLDSWGDIPDESNGNRSRSSNLNDEERYLGDVLGGTVLAVGGLSNYTLSPGVTTKVNEFILINSNDGMLKVYKYRPSDSINPYGLKFNYISGSAERDGGRTIIQDLKERADKKYGESSNPHLYYGNGNMSQLTSPRGQGIVVSSLGQGGRGVFALNIFGVKDVDTSSKVGLDVEGTDKWINSVPLWDTSAKINSGSESTIISDMGYTVSRPVIDLVALKRNPDASKDPIITGASADVRMVAFVANGYENGIVGTKPTLHIIDAIGSKMSIDGATDNNTAGKLIKSFVLDVATLDVDVGEKTGLSSPIAVDLDGDDISDIAYAGDQNGNIYRFDLRGEDPDKWKASILFKGSPSRPITIAPKIYRRDGNSVVVLFGTGSEIYESDGNMSDEDSEKKENLQEMYGVIDNVSPTNHIAETVTREKLLEQELVKVVTSDTKEYRETTEKNLTSSDKGWRLTLSSRERIVKDIEVYNGTVFFNTTIIKPMEQVPAGAICFASEAQGSGWSMELKAANGSMPSINDAHIHSVPDGAKGSKAMSGLYVEGFTLGAPTLVRPTINVHTDAPFAHEYYGTRTVSGQSGFGVKSKTTGKLLGYPRSEQLRQQKCVPNEDGKGVWIALPNNESGADQENVEYKGFEIKGACNLNEVVEVRRISWAILG